MRHDLAVVAKQAHARPRRRPERKGQKYRIEHKEYKAGAGSPGGVCLARRQWSSWEGGHSARREAVRTHGRAAQCASAPSKAARAHPERPRLPAAQQSGNQAAWHTVTGCSAVAGQAVHHQVDVDALPAARHLLDDATHLLASRRSAVPRARRSWSGQADVEQVRHANRASRSVAVHAVRNMAPICRRRHAAGAGGWTPSSRARAPLAPAGRCQAPSCAGQRRSSRRCGRSP